MKNTKNILSEASWMIHELRDADKISNDEEEKLVDALAKAREEIKTWDSVVKFLLKLDEWMDSHDSLASNSLAHAELDRLLEIRAA